MIKTLLNNFNPEQNTVLWLSVAALMAFAIAYQAFPAIFKVAIEKQLMDEPDSRSLHSYNIPTLGGVGIYISLIVVMTLVGAFLNTKVLLLLMGGLTILFFLGLKDDLMVLSPRKKLVGQLFAATLLIVFTDYRIIGFSNILEISTLPYWVSIGFTLFVYILIINAYNLIDGVDGLAGVTALSVAAVFVYLFVGLNDLSLATIAIALCGALVAFLRLNLSQTNKIFMGDTGSMIIGFLLAFFTISFINMAQSQPNAMYHNNAPAIAFALLFYPLMDTLRVFCLRMFILKRSPFEADRNHIHHRFIDAGFSHVQTTLTITGLSLINMAIAFNMKDLNLNTQILMILINGIFLFSSPFLVKNILKNRTKTV